MHWTSLLSPLGWAQGAGRRRQGTRDRNGVTWIWELSPPLGRLAARCDGVGSISPEEQTQVSSPLDQIMIAQACDTIAGRIASTAHPLPAGPRRNHMQQADSRTEVGTKPSDIENKVTVSSIARRRLAVVMCRLKMAETVSDVRLYLFFSSLRVPRVHLACWTGTAVDLVDGGWLRGQGLGKSEDPPLPPPFSLPHDTPLHTPRLSFNDQ